MAPAASVRFESDCSACVGLCCVASTFSKSTDFAISKPAGVPCPNLTAEHRCGIHDNLLGAGFSGCVSFECYGAGQRVSASLDGPVDWRSSPDSTVSSRFLASLGVCELGFHLDALLQRPDLPAGWDVRLKGLRDDVLAELETLSDVGALRGRVGPVLNDAGLAIRRRDGKVGPEHPRVMWLGKKLARRSFRRGSFFAACLLGADLRGADLRLVDFLGTDLRGADLRAADLRGALFLTHGQLVGTRGDAATRWDGVRPPTWTT